ncbi:hypothetical protein L1887_30265 [Cichorium endivia]|nr:hypothetical protein L1887_30265 [Cichorium endivia]
MGTIHMGGCFISTSSRLPRSRLPFDVFLSSFHLCLFLSLSPPFPFDPLQHQLIFYFPKAIGVISVCLRNHRRLISATDAIRNCENKAS